MNFKEKFLYVYLKGDKENKPSFKYKIQDESDIDSFFEEMNNSNKFMQVENDIFSKSEFVKSRFVEIEIKIKRN